MKDLNFVAMHALFGRKVSDGVKPGKLAVMGPVDHQRGYKSDLFGEIIRHCSSGGESLGAECWHHIHGWKYGSLSR